MSWLAPAERERYARFHAEEDRRMFLLGRVMARLLVGRAAGAVVCRERFQGKGSRHGGFPVRGESNIPFLANFA